MTTPRGIVAALTLIAANILKVGLKKDSKVLAEILSRIKAIEGKENKIMSLVDDIKASQEATKAAIAGIVADEKAQADKIQALMDQLKNGAGVTTAQLQELLDGSKAVQKTAEDADAALPVDTAPPGP